LALALFSYFTLVNSFANILIDKRVKECVEIGTVIIGITRVLLKEFFLLLDSFIQVVEDKL
jgi:hypothetical protein